MKSKPVAGQHRTSVTCTSTTVISHTGKDGRAVTEADALGEIGWSVNWALMALGTVYEYANLPGGVEA